MLNSEPHKGRDSVESSTPSEALEVSKTSEVFAPTISCIICTYNRDRYLAKALDSLIHQTLSPDRYEIILVDNASTDKTAEIARRYQHLPNFRYLYEPQQGLSIARNSGVAKAVGQFVAFLDDDAIAVSDWGAQILNVFLHYPDVAGVGGKVDLIWESPRPAWVEDGMLAFFAKLDLSAHPIYLENHLHAYGCNMAFRKGPLLAVGGFSEKLGIIGEKMLTSEEILVQDKLREKGHHIYYHPAVAVQHHVQPEKVTQDWFLKRFLGQGESIAQMELLANSMDPTARLKQVIQAIDDMGDIAALDPANGFQKKGNLLIKSGYISQMLSTMNHLPLKKKVLLITHGTYLNKNYVVTGNSVRAYYLAKGFTEHDIEVVHAYPRELDRFSEETPHLPGVKVASYQDKAALTQLIQAEAPDVLFMGYWELLEDLPEENEIPVIVDVSTPRILEQIYEGSDIQAEMHRMMKLYPKADLFVAGNQKQKHFLLSWLIMAGFDCQEEVPIVVLPLSAEPGAPKHKIGNTWNLVSGGVSSAWRNSQAYIDAIHSFLSGASPHAGHLHILKGKYLYAPQEATETIKTDHFTQLPLMTYAEMEAFFAQEGHIGLELCQPNLEREYSQSFRSLEYLRQGMPIICNDYLEMADHIRSYDAGWVISSPAELPVLLEEIFAAPKQYSFKSANAIRLVNEQFHYEQNIRLLVEFVKTPQRAAKKPVNWKSVNQQGASGSLEFKVLSGW